MLLIIKEKMKKAVLIFAIPGAHILLNSLLLVFKTKNSLSPPQQGRHWVLCALPGISRHKGDIGHGWTMIQNGKENAERPGQGDTSGVGTILTERIRKEISRLSEL